MADPPNHPTRRHRRSSWRLYVNVLRKRLLLVVSIFLFVYAFLVFVLTFVWPSVALDQSPAQQSSVTERAMFAIKFLAAGQTSWPAILCVLIPTIAIVGMYVAYHAGGPLYRIARSAQEWQQGNLSLRIQLRTGDELRGLAEALNEVVMNLEQALVRIRDHEANERHSIRQYLDEMRSQPSVNHESLKQLELALKEGEQIDGVLKRFRISTSE